MNVPPGYMILKNNDKFVVIKYDIKDLYTSISKKGLS